MAAATPGEPHRQVVDRLEVPARGRGDLGLVALEVEHVADRVGAGRRRDAAGAADPGRQRAWRVALHRAADHGAGVRRSAGVASTARTGPTGAPASSTGTVLAHWPVTLTADAPASAADPVRRDARTLADQLPPGRGVLDRAAAGEPSVS